MPSTAAQAPPSAPAAATNQLQATGACPCVPPRAVKRRGAATAEPNLRAPLERAKHRRPGTPTAPSVQGRRRLLARLRPTSQAAAPCACAWGQTRATPPQKRPGACRAQTASGTQRQGQQNTQQIARRRLAGTHAALTTTGQALKARPHAGWAQQASACRPGTATGHQVRVHPRDPSSALQGQPAAGHPPRREQRTLQRSGQPPQLWASLKCGIGLSPGARLPPRLPGCP
jgi:hypothetical protein